MISQMDIIITETIIPKMRMKEDDIIGNRRTAIKMVRLRHANGGLQNC
jgi:hypothetical protein